MSKKQLLEIQNVNIFPNTNEKVTFLLGKDGDGGLKKSIADFSGWDQQAGIDVKAVNQTSGSGKHHFIRLSITLGEGEAREFYNGALFINKRKREGSNQPDYTGQLDLTRVPNGPVLQLAAWNKIGRESGKPFISMNITENAPANIPGSKPTPVAESESAPAEDASKAVPGDQNPSNDGTGNGEPF